MNSLSIIPNSEPCFEEIYVPNQTGLGPMTSPMYPVTPYPPMIANPGAVDPGACIAQQYGQGNLTQEQIYACSAAGYVGVRIASPGSGIANSNIPKNVTMVMPTITGTAEAVMPNPYAQLSPGDLLKPLPSIANSAPVEMGSAPCDRFTEWINRNPLLAVGLLAGLAYFTFGKGK